MESQDRLMMEEALPRLADSMKSVLTDAHIQLIGQDAIDIQFDGLPSWKIAVVRQLVNHQHQLIETQIDLMPLCLASMSYAELQRLAATENMGLRGVTVQALDPVIYDGRGGLRIRASFVGQKGRSTDEVENLAIDILTVLAFARTLEDRVTDMSIAGEFSFELYTSRIEAARAQPTRFITTGQRIFEGSQDRVFAEVMKTLVSEFSFEVRSVAERTALIRAPGSELEILAKIPNEIPIFIAHAPLMKLDGLTPAQIFTMVSELNAQGEAGHFEANLTDGVLNFTAWKHLTNDLRHFSFDHVIFSVARAMTMAQEARHA